MKEKKIINFLKEVKESEISQEDTNHMNQNKLEILNHCLEDELISPNTRGFHLTSDGSEFLDRKQGLSIQGKSYDLQKMKLVVAGSHLLIGTAGFTAGRLI